MSVVENETFDKQDSADAQSVESSFSKPLDPNRAKYNLAATEFTIKVNPYPHLKKKVITTHLVRRPKIEEEERKERMTPLITKSAGKVGDAQAQQTQVDLVPGDRYLYERIIQKVWGYSAPGVTETEEGLDPQTIVRVRDDNGDMVEKPLVEAIPDDHKSLVVNSLFPSNPSSFEVVENSEISGFSLVGGQEWTVRQLIGGQEQLDDGTFSAPDYVIEYLFHEPSANDMKSFRTKAFAVKTWNDKNGVQNEERRIILPVVTELFDKLVASMDGVTIATDKTAEEFDVRNRDHVALVPASFKKNSVLKLFSFLQADLGKSASA